MKQTSIIICHASSVHPKVFMLIICEHLSQELISFCTKAYRQWPTLSMPIRNQGATPLVLLALLLLALPLLFTLQKFVVLLLLGVASHQLFAL